MHLFKGNRPTSPRQWPPLQESIESFLSWTYTAVTHLRWHTGKSVFQHDGLCVAGVQCAQVCKEAEIKGVTGTPRRRALRSVGMADEGCSGLTSDRCQRGEEWLSLPFPSWPTATAIFLNQKGHDLITANTEIVY